MGHQPGVETEQKWGAGNAWGGGTIRPGNLGDGELDAAGGDVGGKFSSFPEPIYVTGAPVPKEGFEPQRPRGGQGIEFVPGRGANIDGGLEAFRVGGKTCAEW